MRRLAVGVLDHSYVVCAQSRVDLSTNNQRRQIIATETIYQRSSVWSIYKRTIQTHINRSHSIARKNTAAIGYCNRHLSGKIIRAAAVIRSYSTEVEPSL